MRYQQLSILGLSSILLSCHGLLPPIGDKILFRQGTDTFGVGSLGAIEVHDNCVRDIEEKCDSDTLVGVVAEFSDPTVFEIVQVTDKFVSFKALSEGTSTLTVSGMIGDEESEASIVLEARTVDHIELYGPPCLGIRDAGNTGDYAFSAPAEFTFRAVLHGGGEELGGSLDGELEFEIPEGVTRDERTFTVSSETPAGSFIRIRAPIGDDELAVQILEKPSITGIHVRWGSEVDNLTTDSSAASLGATFDLEHKVCNEENITFTAYAGPLEVCGLGVGQVESKEVPKTSHTESVQINGSGTCDVMVEVISGGQTLQARDSFEIRHVE